jgi:MFS transporter, MFS domain-containing protein family, molybdate-anion transporter
MEIVPISRDLISPKSLLLKSYFKVGFLSLISSLAHLAPELTRILDKRILVLGFISCCFEGSMYIFVFYWSAAMKSAHALSIHVTDESNAANIPFGVIFATFMAAMMLGSLGFTYASFTSSSSRFSSITGILTPSTLLTLAIAGASISVLLTVLLRDESITFWAFYLFEACVGIYFPSMSTQRAAIVDDGVRAKIYGILRIPLNIFVVVALTTTVEGDAHRDRVFVFCGGLLLLASLAAVFFLADEKPEEANWVEEDERLE